MTKKQIESLRTLDAKQASQALNALWENPHVAMIAGAQMDYCMRGTHEPLSDKLWNSIKGEMKDAWADDWMNTSNNQSMLDLCYEHGICDVQNCADSCAECRINEEGQ